MKPQLARLSPLPGVNIRAREVKGRGVDERKGGRGGERRSARAERDGVWRQRRASTTHLIASSIQARQRAEEPETPFPSKIDSKSTFRFFNFKVAIAPEIKLKTTVLKI